jgi:uncharacterized protein (DUF1778 family)
MLELPVTPARKKRIKRAANLRGTSVSEFVLSCVDEATARVLGESPVWRLDQEQSQQFVDLLLNPPRPNERMKRAAKTYLRWEKKQDARPKLGH